MQFAAFFVAVFFASPEIVRITCDPAKFSCGLRRHRAYHSPAMSLHGGAGAACHVLLSNWCGDDGSLPAISFWAGAALQPANGGRCLAGLCSDAP